MRDPKCFHVQGREDQSVARAVDGLKTRCQKGIKRGVRNLQHTGRKSAISGQISLSVKRFGSLGFKGATQEDPCQQNCQQKVIKEFARAVNEFA